MRISVPLTQPLPGTAASAPYSPPTVVPPTEVTVLPNGARIVSEASSGPTTSIGVYINSGSIFESSYNSGCSAMMECLAFKSTKHRSSNRIMKEVERIGSSVIANASREQMSYTVDCLKTSYPAALELLCDSIINPRFHAPEVEEQKERLLQLLTNKELQMTLLNEMLIRNAYTGGLGKPLIPDPEQVTRLTSSVLHEFAAAHYTAPNIVLAAAGVNHQELVDLVTPMLSSLPTSAPSTPSQPSSSSSRGGSSSRSEGSSVSGLTPEPASKYIGSFVSMAGSFPQTNLTLAFEYSGGWRNVKGAVVMTVLTYLLGGGNSFSSGGPGKGMHSRLYTRVLNQHAWVHSCSAFNSTFNDSGLVGIAAACDPTHVQEMLNVMCNELESVTRALTRTELDRAKRAAVSVICNALESKQTSAEDIGRQFLTYGHRISGRTYVEMIEAVTQQDIVNFIHKLLQSKPSLAVFGDNSESVKYEDLVRRYQN
ncbi:MAG: hypothetical protein WDW36_002166 [Sanguina aurantia]